MPFIPPDYIDNSQISLGTVLNRLIVEMEQHEAAFASGYFEPRVWRMIGAALQRLMRFRLLLGRQPEIDLPHNDLISLRSYYRHKLQGDLETLQFNAMHVQLVEELVAFLQRSDVEVRLFSGPFLHAKAYIFPHYAIVGSSNFTPSGLNNNAELNLVTSTQAIARDLLENWYERQWLQGANYKPELIGVLEASKFGSRAWTPYEVFIKALYEYYRGRLTPESDGSGVLDLAVFQHEGLQEAIRLLDRHNGVLVADAVGLGKTFIGLGLLEHYLINQRQRGHIPQGLVICPAQLRNTVWEPRLREYQIAVPIVSMEELGRTEFPWKEYYNVDFVLVDESHNFRNPATTRYRNLFRLVAAGKRDKRVALLTATPINNTIWDLYHQMMLLAKGEETAYREIGVANLRGFFARVDKGEAELFDLLESTTVRRSRRDIQHRQEAGEQVVINGTEIRFPERRLSTITYDLDGSYAGFYREIARDIDRLTLVSYNIEQFHTGKHEQTTIDRNNAIIGIFKTLLLKRLESSILAFENSVRRQQHFQRRFYDVLTQHNRLLSSGVHRRELALLAALDETADKETDATLEKALTGLPSAHTQEYDLPTLKQKLEIDLAIFDGLLARLDHIRQSTQKGHVHDDKLEQVKLALAAPPLHGKKTLIFSYYEQTARYLYESLRDDAQWQATVGSLRLALLTGRNNAAERKSIIERFAPRANGQGNVSDEIDMLISTDVLSEGQNLQDAAVLINYDLHWNPVRMIQRAGRIDRVGSPHAELLIVNCFPEEELERLLGLIARLQVRITAIGRNLGNDASILGEVVTEKSLDELKRLRAADQSVLDDLAAEEEVWLSSDDMRLPLVAYMQALGEDVVRDIPMGIHSGRSHQSFNGVFFAFRTRERQFWRLYETHGGLLQESPITDKRRIFQMIACGPQTPRVIPKHLIWSYLERATKDILTELQQQQGTQRLPPPMSRVNYRLYNVLEATRSKAIRHHTVSLNGAKTDVMNRLLVTLQRVSLKPFERDPELRSILDAERRGVDVDEWMVDLDAFIVDRGLAAEFEMRPATFAAIKAEDLELVCYELFSMTTEEEHDASQGIR
ncbi:MAG: helicase [Herpetosiphonaceae bacterium]|nr:helicase [Herpetosiphonaceae bacterium]